MTPAGQLPEIACAPGEAFTKRLRRQVLTVQLHLNAGAAHANTKRITPLVPMRYSLLEKRSEFVTTIANLTTDVASIPATNGVKSA